MRFKTLPIFTLATYRMGSNFSIRVTPNINLITVGLSLNRVGRNTLIPVLELHTVAAGKTWEDVPPKKHVALQHQTIH